MQLKNFFVKFSFLEKKGNKTREREILKNKGFVVCKYTKEKKNRAADFLGLFTSSVPLSQ